MTGCTRRSPRGRQRGVALYLFVIAAAITMTALVMGAIGVFDPARSRAVGQDRILSDARRLLLTHLSNPDFDTTGIPRRLGEPGLLPDLPIATGAGADASEPNYDGLGETTGCARRGWVPGAILGTPDVSGPAARCIGRFPWQALGLALAEPTPQDPQGEIPWLVMSPNLKSALYLRDLTPTTLTLSWSGYGAANRPPYPWIVVRDARGNVISDRVAAALILPGPPVAGQVRSATAGPAAFLDSLTVAPTCTAPCQPGTWNNADHNHPDTVPTTLINGPSNTSAATSSALYATPLQFNDRLVWITVDELLVALERRARAALLVALKNFRTTHGYFPFASVLGDETGACVNGKTFGHVPVATGDCGAIPVLPAWFIDAGWHRYFVYAASPRCIAGNPACNPPGLLLDLATGGSTDTTDALIVSPGAAIETAPFAPSRAGPQLRASGATFSVDPRDWLDDPTNAMPAGTHFRQTEGQPSPANDRLEIVE